MKPQKKNGLLVLTIVLIIVVLGLGGFVIYDKLLNNGSTKDNCQTCEKCTQSTTNTYSIFANKYIINRGQKISRIDDVRINQQLGIDGIQIQTNGDAYLSLSSTLANHYGSSYKVLSDVLTAYVLEFGNGGFRTIIFVKEDGTLTAIDASRLINDKTISLITSFGSVQNVVNVIQTTANNAMTVTAIDINGNIYALDSYLK